MNPARVAAAVFTVAAAQAAAAPTYCNDAPGWAQARAERRASVGKLRARQFAELDAFYGAAQRDYEEGRKSDAHVAALFEPFEDASADLAAPLEEWVRQHPRSYVARRALAGHLHAAAFARKAGSEGAEEAPVRRPLLERMIDELNQADALVRKPTLSYAPRIFAVRVLAGPLAAREVFQRAEALDPLNATAKSAYVQVTSPRWGGTPEQRAALAEGKDPWPADLARFVAYRQEMVQGEAFEKAGEAGNAIKSFEKASSLCRAMTPPLVSLIRLYKDAGNAEGVRIAAEYYVTLVPESGWGHLHLAWALSRLKRMDEAFRHYSRAADLGERTGLEGLAWHYAGGHGVPRDPGRALDLYLKVQDRGGNVKPQIERLRKELGR